MIYLDNAATTWPKPQSVREATLCALRDYGANPGRSGYAMAMRTTRAVYECRDAVAEFFGAAGAECVSFQPSCTQAINLVLKGFVKPGDHVLVSDFEHNAVLRPLEEIKKRGVTTTVVRTVVGDNDATVDAFRKAMQPNTTLIVCTQASNVYGVRLPVERLAALAHLYGAKICVDAAQSAGLVPIHLQRDGIDFLCCAGHKGLYGLMGTGVLVLGDPQASLATLLEGGTGTQSRSLLQPSDPPERYESGTLNVPGIVALHAGVQFVKQRGEKTIWQEELQKTRLLYDRLSGMDRVVLYTPPPQMGEYLPVLSFTVKNQESEQTGELLAKTGIAVRCGLHCAPLAHEKLSAGAGTVRVAPSVFTRKEEIEALARQVAHIAAAS